MAENFHIVGRTSNLGTVQKTYNWQIRISKPSGVLGTDWTSDLLLKAKTASIPGVTINNIESMFMGMKQNYAGNATLEHTLSVEFEEFEDQKVHGYLHAWVNTIFDSQSVQDGGGGSVANKSDYATTIELQLYSSDRKKLPKKITFHNAWIQNVAQVDLSYGDAGAVKFSTTFQWDYYTVDSTGA